MSPTVIASYTPGLTRTESRIMAELAGAEGRVVRAERLVELLYRRRDAQLHQSIAVQVCRIRRKLGPEAITTVWGYGYALGDVVRCKHCGGMGYRRES